MKKYAEVEKVETVEPTPAITEHAAKLRAQSEAEERLAKRPKSIFVQVTDQGAGDAEVAKFVEGRVHAGDKSTS